MEGWSAKRAGRAKRVLIGSCGGLTGVYLARRFAGNSNLLVYGADSNPASVGQFFVDEMFLVPPSSDASFVEVLVNILSEGKIDFYIPTHSSEFRVVSKEEERIRQAAGRTAFMVSPFKTFEALDDKLRMTQGLMAAGIPTPAQVDLVDVEDASYPLFIKRRFGSGGAGSMMVASPATMASLLLEHSDIVAYDYIDGPELTIDCMFDGYGRLISYNQRRRIKTLGGAAIITQNDFEYDMEPYLRKFEENWIFKGCVNFQCIIKDGTPYFTDINLRFPSGGLPLTVESGVNIPQMMLDLLAGNELKPESAKSDRQPRVMYRYFEELFAIE